MFRNTNCLTVEDSRNRRILAYCLPLLSFAITASSLAQEDNFPQMELIAGAGPFLKNTSSYRVEVKTDIAAQCRFASTANSNPAGRPFSQMYNKFSSSDNFTHTVDLSAQYNAEQWQLWVKCRGTENRNTSPEPLLITTKFVDDVLPKAPQITVIKGDEKLPENSSSYLVELQTDVTAECKYATSANANPTLRSFAQLPKRLTSENGTTHFTTIGGLYKPKEWSIWAKCKSLETELINEQALKVTATFDIPPPVENKPPKFGKTSFTVNNVQTQIATIEATDPEGGLLTYQLESDPSNLFDLTGDGILSKTDNLEFGQQYQITVLALDNKENSTQATITITVDSYAINQEPILIADELNVTENKTNIGQLLARDPEGTPVTFYLKQDQANLFELSTNGQLSLKDNVSFNRQQQTLYPLEITLVDGDDVENVEPMSVLVQPQYPTAVNVSISDNADHYLVQNGDDEITVWKNKFGIEVIHDNQLVIENIHSRINYRGVNISELEAPSETYFGEDWVEVRGWYWHADESIDSDLGIKPHENGLYYTVRYQFVAGKPYFKTNFSLSDRHNGHKVEGLWHNIWRRQMADNFVVELTTNSELDDHTVRHLTAHAGDTETEQVALEAITDIDSKQWRHQLLSDLTTDLHDQTHLADLESNDIQLFNQRHFDDNQIIISPNFTGTVNLQLAQIPVTNQINDLNVYVHHVNGVELLHVDQKQKTNDLGRFALDKHSKIVITAQHTGYEYAKYVFNRLHLINDNRIIKTIKAQHLTGKLFDSKQYGVVVKDFWQKYPMEASSRDNKISLTMLNTPYRLGPGASVSMEFAINYNTSIARTTALAQVIKSAPEFAGPPMRNVLPDWWHDFDGVYSENVSQDEYFKPLLDKTWSVINHNDVTDDNYGWKNYGDFKISNSYSGTHKDGYRYRTQDWGNQQVDLGLGLMMAWLNTNDDNLWSRAIAANRNARDILISKYEPLKQKNSGAGYRKGPCARFNSHWCQDAIPEFGFHSRALLLNHHLTGEVWSKDVAQMVIDNGAYYAHTRAKWTARDTDRALGWVLRNLYYGAKAFPEGTKYLSQQEGGYRHMQQGTSYRVILNELLDEYIYHFEQGGSRLLGGQPVWQSRIVEGLIMVLEGNLIDDTYIDRVDNQTKDKPAKIRTMLIEALTYLDANEIRIDSNGDYSMLYKRSDNSWRNLRSYGFFWLNSLQWAEQVGNVQLNHSSDDIYRWLAEQYDSSKAPTREWTAILGATNFVDKRH